MARASGAYKAALGHLRTAATLYAEIERGIAAGTITQVHASLMGTKFDVTHEIPDRLGQSYKFVGIVAAALGRTDEALEAFGQARSFFEVVLGSATTIDLAMARQGMQQNADSATLAQVDIGRSCHETAELLARVGRTDEAVDAYRAARAAFVAARRPDRVAAVDEALDTLASGTVPERLETTLTSRGLREQRPPGRTPSSAPTTPEVNPLASATSPTGGTRNPVVAPRPRGDRRGLRELLNAGVSLDDAVGKIVERASERQTMGEVQEFRPGRPDVVQRWGEQFGDALAALVGDLAVDPPEVYRLLRLGGMHPGEAAEALFGCVDAAAVASAVPDDQLADAVGVYVESQHPVGLIALRDALTVDSDRPQQWPRVRAAAVRALGARRVLKLAGDDSRVVADLFDFTSADLVTFLAQAGWSDGRIASAISGSADERLAVLRVSFGPERGLNAIAATSDTDDTTIVRITDTALLRWHAGNARRSTRVSLAIETLHRVRHRSLGTICATLSGYFDDPTEAVEALEDVLHPGVAAFLAAGVAADTVQAGVQRQSKSAGAFAKAFAHGQPVAQLVEDLLQVGLSVNAVVAELHQHASASHVARCLLRRGVDEVTVAGALLRVCNDPDLAAVDLAAAGVRDPETAVLLALETATP